VLPKSCRANQRPAQERAILIGLSNEETDHERKRRDPFERCAGPSTLKQGQTDRREAAIASKPRLVDPHKATAGRAHPRPRAVQPHHRQQIARLRRRGGARR